MLSERRRATRERLLEAAADVFAADGVRAATVEQICAQAGFTRGAFYSNFSSKDELFLALLDREFARRRENLERTTAELAPALQQHDGRIDPEHAAGYIAEFLAQAENPVTWHVLETEFGLHAMRDPDVAAKYVAALKRSHADFVVLVEAALAAARRRFTLPAAHAVTMLIAEHDRALRFTALGGAEAPEGLNDLPSRISTVLFAITEPISHE